MVSLKEDKFGLDNIYLFFKKLLYRGVKQYANRLESKKIDLPVIRFHDLRHIHATMRHY
jgi:integrase